MWLEVGVLNVKVSRATTQEKVWLRELLSFVNPKAHFSGGPATVVLYDVMHDAFPGGWLQYVRNKAAEDGLEVQLLERRKFPCALDPNADLVWLRDYQREAVLKAASIKRGIIWVPTGGGKTEIAVGLSRVVPCNWVFLVHRATLMEQSAERYEKRSPGLVAGRIGEGTWSVPKDCTFVSATFQTISSAIKRGDPRADELFERTGGIIVDESHVLPASQFSTVARKFYLAPWRVGLSGTPLARGDRRSREAISALGSIIYRIKPEILIAEGVLARPHIKLIECKQRSDAPTWQGVYGESIVRSAPRNRLIVEAVKRAKAKGPVLVFVKELAHGRILEKLLWKHGISAEFTHGTHSTEFRKSKIKTLTSGRVDALICSVIFQEGVDIPELRSVVIGSGGKSVIAALQRIGRGMRVAAGKTDFDVYDIMDRGCGCKEGAKALGTPGVGLHAGCKWLDKHARERLSAYSSEGYSTAVEQWTAGFSVPAEEARADAAVCEAVAANS